jgi:hypothetical protein
MNKPTISNNRRRYRQGKFVPKNPEKYIGDPSNIIYRSSWEYIAFQFCDRTTWIKKYGSEEVVIPYISPLDNRVHRYYMDLIFVAENKDGKQQTFLVEIKPKAQTQPPKTKNRKSKKKLLNEVTTYSVNKAKWEATEKFCKQKGWKFLIWTEDDLFPKNKKTK